MTGVFLQGLSVSSEMGLTAPSAYSQKMPWVAGIITAVTVRPKFIGVFFLKTEREGIEKKQDTIGLVKCLPARCSLAALTPRTLLAPLDLTRTRVSTGAAGAVPASVQHSQKVFAVDVYPPAQTRTSISKHS